MVELLRDLRFGLRLLARSPVFTATAALLLAIGISANTLIFSVTDALLLRRLPIARPESLVRLVELHPTNFVTWTFPYGLCQPLATSPDFSGVFCEGEADLAFDDGISTERERVHLVSPNFFSSLGVPAQIGRVLTPQDDHVRAMNAVLSDDFWTRRYHRDPKIIGRSFTLHGYRLTVVGVLPRGFNGLAVDTSADIRVPASLDRFLIDPFPESKPGVHPLFAQIFGRLRPGADVQRANAGLDAFLRPISDDLFAYIFPDMKSPSNTRVIESHFTLESIPNGVSALRSQFSRGLEVLMAAVGLLLLMACANVAGLLLARSAVRAHEVGVRLALGASPGRIARQLFTESIALAVIGGIAGTLLTFACRPLLLRMLPPVRDRAAVIQPLAVHIDIDVRVLSFTLVITLLTAVLFGLSPALRGARTDLAGVLRSTRTSTARLFPRNAIVMAQVALCTLILIGTAQLVATLERMRSMDAGFDRDHVLTFTIDPELKNYTVDQTLLLRDNLLRAARALPSVVSVGIATRAVMRGTGVKSTVAAAGSRIVKGDFLNTSLNNITPGYFETMGIRIVAGREYTPAEENEYAQGNEKDKPPLTGAVVNQAFVRRFFPRQNPIGKRFGSSGPDGMAKPTHEIVGVVTDAKYRSLREPVPPTVYYPLAKDNSGFILHVRTRQRPEIVMAPIREALHMLDPQLPFIEVRTLRDEVEMSLWQERLLAQLSTIFGIIAAMLAGIGLYGALDFAVKSRTREIGVRVALGAEPACIVRLLSREIVLLVGSGIALGLCVYAFAAASIHKLLYDARPWEPVAIVPALSVIVMAAVLATAAPIWRGIRLDPAAALRVE